MKVFISWSGPSSLRFATILRDWLTLVLPSTQCWVSSEDLRKGTRWAVELGKHLEAADFGILCVDASNLEEPWLNYEAGALGKELGARVAPILLGLEPGAVSGPLAQYQLTRFEQDDMRRLVVTMAECSGNTAAATVRRAFDRFWPTLEQLAPEVGPTSPGAKRPTRRRRRLASIDGDILRVITELPDTQGRTGLTVDDLVAELDLSSAKGEYYLRRLADDGLVHESDGSWHLTSAGLEYVVRRGLAD